MVLEAQLEFESPILSSLREHIQVAGKKGAWIQIKSTFVKWIGPTFLVSHRKFYCLSLYEDNPMSQT